MNDAQGGTAQNNDADQVESLTRRYVEILLLPHSWGDDLRNPSINPWRRLEQQKQTQTTFLGL
jgi:hypothetical protein